LWQFATSSLRTPHTLCSVITQCKKEVNKTNHTLMCIVTVAVSIYGKGLPCHVCSEVAILLIPAASNTCYTSHTKV